MKHNFWENKRVLITGHTGFKGSWMSILLKRLGANIYGLSLPPPTAINLYNLADVEKVLSGSYIEDIRDFDAIASIIDKVQPNFIFHMAAQSLVHESYREPRATFSTNIMGTVNILEAVRIYSHECNIINVTSDKCYDNKNWIWPYRENDAMGGYDPYSCSKGCSELITSSFRNSFFKNSEIHIASARAGNVIGGGDWADNRLIPDILKAHENKQVLKIRSPGALRPWQHVIEALYGYLTLAEKLSEDNIIYQDGWNFGPNDKDVKTVEWITSRLLKHLDSKLTLEIDNNELYEANTLKLDSSKAHAILGWFPTWDIDHALQKVAEWYLAYKSGSDIHNICISQINEFMEGVIC